MAASLASSFLDLNDETTFTKLRFGGIKVSTRWLSTCQTFHAPEVRFFVLLSNRELKNPITPRNDNDGRRVILLVQLQWAINILQKVSSANLVTLDRVGST